MRSQEEEKEKIGFLWRRGEEEKEKEKETSVEENGLEPSLYTQKGIKNYAIPNIPLCILTGYYILPSL